MSRLTLYYKPTCPYCHKVLSFMENAGIHLSLKNILESPEAREELTAKGGKSQVPALEIDGKIMYESEDIIAYLKEHAA